MCMFCSPNFIGWTLCHRNRWTLAVETRCSIWCCPALCRGARFSKRASFSRLAWGAFRYRSNDSTESTLPSRTQRKCFRRSSQTRGFSWFSDQFQVLKTVSEKTILADKKRRTFLSHLSSLHEKTVFRFLCIWWRFPNFRFESDKCFRSLQTCWGLHKCRRDFFNFRQTISWEWWLRFCKAQLKLCSYDFAVFCWFETMNLNFFRVSLTLPKVMML